MEKVTKDATTRNSILRHSGGNRNLAEKELDTGLRQYGVFFLAPIITLPFHVALVGAWFLLAGGLGQLFFRRIPNPPGTLGAHLLFKTLLGHGLLCYAVFVAGLAGLFSRGELLTLGIAAGLFCRNGILEFVFELRRLLIQTALKIGEAAREPASRRPAQLFLLASGLLLVALMIIAHTPPVLRDDLSYHLYIPRAYLEMGRISSDLFDQAQSYYPHILNLPEVPMLALGGDLAAKILNIAFAALLAGAVALLAIEAGAHPIPLPPYGGGRGVGVEAGGTFLTGLAAAAATLAAPLIIFCAGTGLADLPAAVFALAGFLGLCLYAKETDRRRKTAYLWTSATLGALALNKYTIWSYPFATAALFGWIERHDPKRLFRGILIYGALMAVALTPLAVYLWAIKGNPLYPLPFLNLPFDGIEAANLTATTQGRSLEVFLGFVWHDFLGAAKLNSSPFVALAVLAPIFCPFLRPPIRSPFPPPSLLIIWIVLGLLLRYLATGESALIPRYIIVTHAASIALGALVWQKIRKRSRLIGDTFAATSLLVAGLGLALPLSEPHWRFNLGLMSRDNFLERFYPSEGWGMVEAVNRLLSKGDKHLFPQEKKAVPMVAVLDHHFTPYYYRASGSRMRQVPYTMLEMNDLGKIHSELSRMSLSHVLFITSQWIPERTSRGTVWNALYFAPYIRCRWWEESAALSFLKPVFHTPGAVLFEVQDGHPHDNGGKSDSDGRPEQVDNY